MKSIPGVIVFHKRNSTEDKQHTIVCKATLQNCAPSPRQQQIRAVGFELRCKSLFFFRGGKSPKYGPLPGNRSQPPHGSCPNFGFMPLSLFMAVIFESRLQTYGKKRVQKLRGGHCFRLVFHVCENFGQSSMIL